jgi:hypothetical protein
MGMILTVLAMFKYIPGINILLAGLFLENIHFVDEEIA